MKIHGYASESHYRDHVAAVWDALDPESQGVFLHHDLLTLQKTRPNKNASPEDWWLVSSVQDASSLKAIHRNTQVILLEHGVGQTYIGSRGLGCIGTERAKVVDTFWMPNNRAAQLQSACCSKPVHVIYPHRLDVLQRLRSTAIRSEKPLVVFSFHHHQIGGCPEQRSTYGDWLGEIETMLGRDDFDVVGHAHPREQELLRRWRAMRVPVIETFDEVVQRADLYVCDNSSTIYEAAALGIPVVVLHGHSYRPAVKHGLRFYQFANVGLIASARNEDPAAQLLDAITKTLAENPQKARAAEISAALFDRSAPKAEELARQLGRKQVTKTMSTPTGWAKALRDIKNDKTGVVKQGQLFRPGFHHTQWDGAAVPGSQTHPKPDAALALMVSNRMAVACEAPTAVSSVEAPAADPVELTEAKPIRRKHHDADSDPRPIWTDLGGPTGSPASVDEPVSEPVNEKTGGRKKRRGQLLPE